MGREVAGRTKMMRKWFIIMMTTLGIIIFISLGQNKPEPKNILLNDNSIEISTAGGTVQDQLQATLKVAVSLQEKEYLHFSEIANQFEQLHPEIKLEIINIPELKWQIDLFSFDIIMAPLPIVRINAAQGRLFPLDEFISAERKSQWLQPVLGAVSWNEYTWAIPYDWNPYVLVMNQEVLAQRSEPLENFTDWLIDYSEKAVIVRKDPYVMTVIKELTSSPIELQPPNEIDILLEKLAARSTETIEEIVQLFQDARIHSTFMTLNDASQMASQLGQDGSLSIIAVPSRDGNSKERLPLFQGRGFVVSPTTNFPKEAVEWILYVTEKSQTDKVLLNGGSWPIYRANYDISTVTSRERERTTATALGEAEAIFPLAQTFQNKSWKHVSSFMQRLETNYQGYQSPPLSLE
jgi:ABC-type glycerol-3-phosphate transport system substrate-binding protein